MLYRGRGFKDPKERTVSFTPGAASGHFWKIQRRSDRPCESAFEPRSVRGILIEREKAEDEEKAERERRRWGRKREGGSFNKNLTSGPLCEGNHSKRSRRETAVSLPEGRHEKHIVKRKETEMENACRGWPINFSMGKLNAPIAHLLAARFVSTLLKNIKNSTDCQFVKAS